MSRRNKTSSNVRGPNSALTEFLRNEGITEAFRERRALEQSGAASEGTQINTPAEVSVATSRRSVSTTPSAAPVEEEDEEVIMIRQAARRKRKARRIGGLGDADDDDDDDDDYVDNNNDNNNGSLELDSRYRQSGEDELCVDCGKKFILSVYSRFDKLKHGYLCEECNQELKKRERELRKNEMNAKRKRKRVAKALLNKNTVKLPTLQDVCIKTITKNINDVEALGDIGQVNLNKISAILSKNRSLNNSTMTLFLNPGLKSLEFWDCSNVDSDSFNKIAAYSPNIESLTLYMCGQFHNDNLEYFNSNLTNLKELNLNGPFLISDAAWQEFFESSGNKLTKFEIRNTHRFGNDSFISLLESCGANLTALKLSRLDGIDSASVYELLPHYLKPSNLQHLEISYPHKEILVTDELLINVLAITGETLQSLNVDGCSELTDKFVEEGIVKFCPQLTHLSMRGLDLLTNEVVATAFKDYHKVNSGGFISLNLTKCVALGDEAVYEILNCSSATLVELSLNSVNNLTKDCLWQILTDDFSDRKKEIRDIVDKQTEEDENKLRFFPELKFPLLTTLDIGFVRNVDNEILRLLGNRCPKLRVLEVFGDNKCTSKAKTREDLIIIGRQSDMAL